MIPIAIDELFGEISEVVLSKIAADVAIPTVALPVPATRSEFGFLLGNPFVKEGVGAHLDEG
mgnify:CR=1 FL=1